MDPMGIIKHLYMYLFYEYKYKPAIVCICLYANKQSSKPTSHQATGHGALDEATVTEYPETIVTSREGRNKPSTLGTIGTYSSHALLRNSRFYDLPVQALLALYKWYTWIVW